MTKQNLREWCQHYDALARPEERCTFVRNDRGPCTFCPNFWSMEKVLRSRYKTGEHPVTFLEIVKALSKDGKGVPVSQWRLDTIDAGSRPRPILKRDIEDITWDDLLALV